MIVAVLKANMMWPKTILFEFWYFTVFSFNLPQATMRDINANDGDCGTKALHCMPTRNLAPLLAGPHITNQFITCGIVASRIAVE